MGLYTRTVNLSLPLTRSIKPSLISQISPLLDLNRSMGKVRTISGPLKTSNAAVRDCRAVTDPSSWNEPLLIERSYQIATHKYLDLRTVTIWQW